MCSFILKQHRNERYVSCDWLKEFTMCFKSMRSSLMMEVTHRLSENTTEEEIGHDEDSDVPLDSRTIGPEPGLIPVSPGLCDWVWWIPALQLKDTRLRRFIWTSSWSTCRGVNELWFWFSSNSSCSSSSRKEFCLQIFMFSGRNLASNSCCCAKLLHMIQIKSRFKMSGGKTVQFYEIKWFDWGSNRWKITRLNKKGSFCIL